MNSHLYYNDDFILSKNRPWHTHRNQKNIWMEVRKKGQLVQQNTQISTQSFSARWFTYSRAWDIAPKRIAYSPPSSDPWDRTRPATHRDIDQRVIFKIRSFMDADPFTGRSLSLDMHFLGQARHRMRGKTSRRRKRVGLIFYFVKLILPKQVHVCEGRPRRFEVCKFIRKRVIKGSLVIYFIHVQGHLQRYNLSTFIIDYLVNKARMHGTNFLESRNDCGLWHNFINNPHSYMSKLRFSS